MTFADIIRQAMEEEEVRKSCRTWTRDSFFFEDTLNAIINSPVPVLRVWEAVTTA